ncbi:MAG: UDP-N-acetylglucosamine--N-acetylmuramyl-(pentapeptide) pyrophosphoryl-undecaprenol N-acetylglucosamine transferase [bacterium]|nr:UDP-N-acetylglucosamine--N-acetylmuramyl-(pentapeptide) pyrophosphoryl-undecaprenol N-acetylglucosamine transferase [bacterium]
MKNPKIMLCGGGTGGHVLPLVAVARAIKKLAPEAKIYFVGPEEFSLNALREESVIVKTIIAAGKIRRYFSFKHIWEIIKIPFAFFQSLIIVVSINPDVVLGKGSYGSVLPVLAAEILFKKIIIHESDAIPGLANKFLSYVTNNIVVSFEETKNFFAGKNIQVVGNPVRLKYLDLTKEEAEKILDFPPKESTPSLRSYARCTIFISGGSQGAQRINKAIFKILPDLLENFNMIWSVGAANYQSVQHLVLDNNLKIVPFLNEKELASAYTLCDIAIGRAGAGTIFELAAFGKPSILIPLERKNGDQPVNASSYAKTGAAVVLKENELDKLKEVIEKILNNSSELDSMSENAKKFAKIDAASQLAQILLDLAK